MRALGLIVLAGAGLGFLLCTDRGRRLTRQAGQSLQDGYNRMGESMGQRRVEKMVENVVEQPHPDTAMAHAFEEAVA